MVKSYCEANAICTDYCRKNHYFSPKQRQLHKSLMTDEMFLFVEEVKEGKQTCQYHMLCYEVDCPYNHSGIAQGGRKLFRKALKDVEKRERAKVKIETDMAKHREGIHGKWEDMTKC